MRGNAAHAPATRARACPVHNGSVDDGREAAVVLGYDPAWLRAGVLTPASAREQLDHFRGPDGDPNVEHYRATTLAGYLARNASFSDAQLQLLLEVARSELQGGLHGHVFHCLVKHRGLTAEQFEAVSAAWDAPGFERIALREELLRLLARQPTHDAVLDRAQREGNSVVHGALLALDLPAVRLEWLAEHGANEAVRRRARVQLARHRSSATSEELDAG